jgi:hypothetical protein
MIRSSSPHVTHEETKSPTETSDLPTNSSLRNECLFRLPCECPSFQENVFIKNESNMISTISIAVYKMP